ARISSLPVSGSEATHAVGALKVVTEAESKCVLEWLDLLVTYLSETSSQSSGEADPLDLAPEPTRIGLSVEERVRGEIGRFVLLPPRRANRSSGCSPCLIDCILAFIERFFFLGLSTQIVAMALGFEPSYFAKTFKTHVRESMTKRLRRVRLERAKRLLENPYLSILEIADRAGFSDASYFARVFHREFAVTPTQYRDLQVEPSRARIRRE
ncbi:MAG TPA: helix-turn-helix transcriptional regulator, partial [Sumerlaeia bacterium]|nr:helix-turn-helix transcriptional regulator [Sumerlaeia bacterium]